MILKIVRVIIFSDILLDKKSHENILIDDISYKTFINAKPLHIWFEKIDGFIKIYDGIRYLILFASERYNAIYDRINHLINEKSGITYDRINYLINEKSGITYSINHNFPRIRIDSYNSLPIEKTLIFHNVITLIKSVVNRNENNYYYIIFFLNEFFYIIKAIFR